MICVEAVAKPAPPYAPVWEQSAPVLLISTGHADSDVLRSILDGSNTRLTVARSYREGVTALGRDAFVLVLCDERLPDGSWKDVLGQIAYLTEIPRLVLIATDPSESLYAEALNLGAWELLQRPLRADEVRRVIEVGIPVPRKSLAARAVVAR